MENIKKCIICHENLNIKKIASFKCNSCGLKYKENTDWYHRDCIDNWNEVCLNNNGYCKCPICSKPFIEIKEISCRYGLINYIRMMDISRYILRLKIKIFFSIIFTIYLFSIKFELKYFLDFVIVIFSISTLGEVAFILTLFNLIRYGYS